MTSRASVGSDLGDGASIAREIFAGKHFGASVISRAIYLARPFVIL